MRPGRLIPTATATLALIAPASALADGAGTPQAVAANAQFLSATPAPPGGAGAVCVIDSGVDATTDLGASLGERDSVLGPPFDDLGATSDNGVALPKHGTYVAGVITSQVDGIGASGIWPAAKIVSNRVFAGGTTTANAYIQALDWCRQPTRHVTVVNLSLAGLQMTNAERSQLQTKISQTRDQWGINVVAGAGNSGFNHLAYPAAYPEVFAVGATDVSGALASFSNRGNALDIATFGTDVCVTTSFGHQLGVGEGTSYAAPIVSAVLDALRSFKPSLTAVAAEQLLVDSARTIGGVKVLDARQAFIAAGLSNVVASYDENSPNPCEVVINEPGDGSGGGPAAARKPRGLAAGSSAPMPQQIVVTDPEVPAPVVPIALPQGDRFALLKPRQPILRRVTLRNGRLRISVSGRRPGERVVFRVDGRRFVRHTSTLTIKARAWKTITIQLERPGIGRGQKLTVDHDRDFA